MTPMALKMPYGFKKKEVKEVKEGAIMGEKNSRRMECVESGESSNESSNCLLLENFLLNKAMEELPIGLTVSDLEGRIVYTNSAEAAMHGYIADELIGK